MVRQHVEVELPVDRHQIAADRQGDFATVDTNLPARIGDGTPKGEDRKDRAADKPKADKPKPVLAKVEDEEEDDKGGGTDKGAGTKVVSIDAFRKKP